ncbi:MULTISPECIES: hypothetical protein [Planotetraspora]|uniref:Uncharacterized protein n=2 Tax=Planotetraspora TaxID=58120 RepID=A0A8J3XMZ5_9ACTN|nr:MULTISPECIES: hypothetical protein [Planotetraspora]GII28309.1 hypothetical protein Pmi06nite_17510 [Planotetraspora mira]GII47014.1 hypothetical protein Psi02_34380 [Planotetraspora silvatica]
MAVSANLDKLLDREYEEYTLDKLVDAPVAALAGVGEAGAEALTRTLGIVTIGDLGRSQLFRYAAALVALADSAK